MRPVRVVFGAGAASEQVGEVLAELGVRRTLLVTTPGRRREAGTIRDALGDVAAGTFDRAAPHVPVSVISAALDEVTRLRVDSIVCVGGGSAIGLGKALALEMSLPLVAVPTTYSGSEMTNIWGRTDGDRKDTGRDQRVAPQAVIYDPMLTAQMPADLRAASGMNAIAHCVEALYAADGHPLSSLMATEGLRTLASSLPDVVTDPNDLAAREGALFGAHLAGWALDMTSMGLHHKLCHVLGGSFGLPHALTHAIVLPYVAAYNAKGAGEAMATIAGVLDATDAWSGLFALRRELGLHATLRDLGLEPAQLDQASAMAVARPYANPREVTRDGVRRILGAAFTGAPPASLG